MSEMILANWKPQNAKKIAALVAYNVSRRTRTRVLTAAKHGTTTGYAWGCACEPCRLANRDAQRKRRSRAA